MARSIVLSVGFGGVNFPEDVSRVRELLAAAASRTPLAAANPVTGGPDLVESIKAFQKQHMGMTQPTGRIDPDSATLYVLNRVALNEESVALAGSLRERIIQAAQAEEGKVSDRKAAVSGKRHGAHVLKGYIDTAGRNNINWADTKKRLYIGPKPAETKYQVTNLEGVEKNGMRIPQDGQGLGVQWCGIFATWAWMTGGADVYWAWPGPARSSGQKIPASGNFKALAPGDMCVLPGGMQHHVIVVSVSADGKKIETIEGNKMWQEIGPDSHQVAKLQTLYSLDSVFNPALKY